MTDLDLLIQFLVDKYPGFRFNLWNYHLTGGYRADIYNGYADGDTPLVAVLALIAVLNLHYEDYETWYINTKMIGGN